MLIAEAKVKDLGTMQWYTYTGVKATKLGTDRQFNQKHPLQVKPNELVGLKVAARGPGAGNYQVVLGHAVHVVFRNVPPKMVERLMGQLKPYKGKLPEHGQLEEGRRRTTKVRIRDRSEGDKQTDDLFRPSGPVRETLKYDRENYQWRKVVHAGTAIKSLKQGRSKYTTQENDVVGLRYMTKARGGFIILPNQQRVNIDHDTYMKLIEGTRILPSSKQQKGIVILADVKASMPKETRNRKPKDPEPDVRTRTVPLRNPVAGIKRDLKKDHLVSQHEELPDSEWDDDEDDLEDDVPAVAPAVPEQHQPNAVMKVGALVQSAKRPANKFIVVDSKRHDTYTEFALFSPTNKDVRKLRLSNDVDMSKYKSVIINGSADKAELAAGKRALNKAVKDKQFTVGSIHD